MLQSLKEKIKIGSNGYLVIITILMLIIVALGITSLILLNKDLKNDDKKGGNKVVSTNEDNDQDNNSDTDGANNNNEDESTDTPTEEEPNATWSSSPIIQYGTDGPGSTIKVYALNLEDLSLKTVYTSTANSLRVSKMDNKMFVLLECNPGKCELFTVEIDSLKKTSLTNIEGDLSVRYFDAYDIDTYSYVTESYEDLVESNFQTEMFISHNGEEKTIFSLTGSLYGRGGSYDDAGQVSFSPDGKSIYYIDTVSTTELSGNKIHIYDASEENLGEKIKTLSDSTQPDWSGNSELVYLSIKDSGREIRSYNLKSKSETTLFETTSGIHYPKSNGVNSDILFQYLDNLVDLGSVALLQDGKDEVILGKSYLSGWLSEDHILYYKIVECTAEFCGAPFNMDGVYVYNLKTGSDTKLAFESLQVGE